MCGLTGMITYNKQGFYQKDRDLFKEMLIVNSLRGAHSTGVFGGRFDEETDFAKAVGNPYDFFEHKEVEKLFNKMVASWRFAVGHGRQATRGAIIGENAHPFKIGHITMSHNGTVFKSDLIDTIKNSVDSKAICDALSLHPAVDVFKDIDGAYAVVYHNEKEKRLNFVRNKERPLTLALDTTNNKVMFASERVMLEMIALRNNIKFSDIFLIPEDTIFSFDEKSFDYTETKIPKKVKHFLPPVQKQNYGNNHNSNYNSPSQVRIIKIVSRKSGQIIKVGDTLNFYIKELVELNSKQKVFQVFGGIENYPEVEINAIWKGEEEDLYNGKEWCGKVTSISDASSRMKLQGTLHNVYVSGISPIDDQQIKTLDGSYISKNEFVFMASSGCDLCKSTITIEDSENCLVDDTYIFCPKCSATFLDNSEQGVA